MKNALLPLYLITLSLSFALNPAKAADQTPPPANEKKAVASRTLPFHGKLVAIDSSGKTITVGKRVFQVSPQSKIMRGQEAVTLSQSMVGTMVGGAYTKADDGSLHIVSMKLENGPDQDPEPKKDPADKSSS